MAVTSVEGKRHSVRAVRLSMRSQTVVPLALQIISHLQREQYAVPLVELRQVLYSSAVLPAAR